MAGSSLIGNLAVLLRLDTSAFEEGATHAQRLMARTQKQLQNVGDRIRTVGTAMTIGLTAPLAAFGTQAARAAIDAEELQSAFNTTFGNLASGMNRWAEATGNAMGRSTQEMQKLANTFGIFFNQAAPTKQAAAQMSQAFAVLAQDLASFYNVDADTALQKLRSGLSGESEPLRDFGVFLSEAAVQAKAMQLGLTGVGNELTEQEKILARYQLILEGTRNAQGDVARTSSSTANQLRAAKSQWEELSVQLGSQLLPHLNTLAAAATAVLQKFSELSPATQRFIVVAAGVAAVLGPIALGIGGLVGGFGAVLPLIVKAGPLFMALASGIGSLVPVVLSAGRALMLLAFNPVGATIMGIAAAVAAVYLAWKNWDRIIAIAQRVYQGVRTWLVDRLNAVWDWVKGKIDQVTGFFRSMYVAVVGNSYVPDMVDEIGTHMHRLQQAMVSPARQATSETEQLFQQLQQRVSGILDRIFPDQARYNRFKSELADLERGGLGEDAAAEARRRLTEEYLRDTDQRSGQDEDIIRDGSLQSAMGTLMETMPRLGAMARNTTAEVVESFANMARDVIGSLRGMVQSFKSGDLLGGIMGMIDLIGQVTGFLRGNLTAAAPVFNRGFGGFRAAGGPVVPGKSYIVGERGPEWFTPNLAGTITPNGSGDAAKVQIIPSPYFDAVVDGRAARVAAPMASQATVGGATGGVAAIQRMQRRRLP